VFGKRSDQPRTAEDRARAAADRAARRRGGSGRTLPPEAFEYTVRPPDVEPHEPFVREEEPPLEEEVAPREDEFAPRDDAPVEAPRDDALVEAPRDDAPVETPRDDAPAATPREEAPPRDDVPAPSPRDEAPVATPRDDVLARDEDDLAAPADEAPRDDVPAAAPHDEAPAAATPRDEAPETAPHDEAPAAATPRDDAPAATPRDDAPAEATPRDEAPEHDEAPADEDELAAARAEAAAEARALRENAGAAQPEIEPTPEVIHQPTVEYTPFQTEEHEVPLGEPRDDEPRLVASRALPRDHDEIHAYAAAPRPETAEHETLFETGEHHAAEEPPPPVPLRKAPPRPPDAAAARRRPAPDQPRRRPPKMPKTPKGPRTSGGSHWGRRIFTLIVVLLFAAVLYAINQTFQPFHGDGSGSVQVTIPENSDVSEVAKLLAAKGVIDSERFFELNATISGERSKFRPGDYTFKQNMTNGAVIDQLTQVPETPAQAPTVDVTLVEGPSIKENDPVVKKSEKVDGSYAKAADSSAVLKRIRDLGAPKGTKSAEGFLFPATYKLKVGSPASELVNQQLDAFDDNFGGVSMKYAKSKKLTRYDVLIIASMIEREAQLPRERRLVSAVIYNRLKQGMPLSIDATTRYSTNNWQRPIKQSELDKQEPYNTRLNRGLPPTPIGNPGLASIKAAANPARGKDYLFYVRKPGDSGEHAFSSTDAQFQRDVAKYQASREP